MKRLMMAAAAFLALLAQDAMAGISYPTNVAGTFADAAVNLQCDASGLNCQPVTNANPVPVSVQGTPATTVTGNVAAGATDSGNSVKIGGVFNTTQPTYTTGQRGDAQMTARGEVLVAIASAGSVTSTGANSADAVAASGVGLNVRGFGYTFNGTTLDRQRGNIDTAALVTHTAASAGVQSADQVNYNGRGVKVVVDVTAITGTSPTLTVTIQGKDAASGKYYTLLTSAALTATGTTVLEVYPGVGVTANVSTSTTLPRTWRISTTIGGTTPAVTATVGASVIL